MEEYSWQFQEMGIETSVQAPRDTVMADFLSQWCCILCVSAEAKLEIRLAQEVEFGDAFFLSVL